MPQLIQILSSYGNKKGTMDVYHTGGEIQHPLSNRLEEVTLLQFDIRTSGPTGLRRLASEHEGKDS